MCLHIITKRLKHSCRIVRAWKGLDGGRGRYAAPCRDFKFIRGKWHQAIRTWIGSDYAGRYSSGFHVHTTREAASHWGDKAVRVEVKGVRTIGKQSGEVVLVADYLRIPFPIRRKKNG